LTADEHAALRRLDGADLTKTRWHDDYAGHTFSIDVFASPLAGLVICEVEAASAEALRTIVFPAYAVIEVSDDPFFTGGQFVVADPSTVQARLVALGLLHDANAAVVSGMRHHPPPARRRSPA
jgi:CYTH domain-containing protein